MAILSPEFMKQLNETLDYILKDKTMESCCKNCSNYDKHTEDSFEYWYCKESRIIGECNPSETVCTAFKEKKEKECKGCYYNGYSGIAPNYCFFINRQWHNKRCENYIDPIKWKEAQEKEKELRLQIAYDNLSCRQKEKFLKKQCGLYSCEVMRERSEKIERNCGNCKNIFIVEVGVSSTREGNLIRYSCECSMPKEYTVYLNKCQNHEFNDDIFELTGKR